MKILVADDAPEVARRLITMLSELDHVEVIGPASNGSAALNLYEQHQPHGAILDLQMPELSGLEVLKSIRSRDKSVLVIILTIEPSEEIRRRCLGAGANHFFHKSADFSQITAIIENFIREKKLGAS